VSGSLVVAAALACAMPASAEENNRLFGFLPNYTTVEERPSEAASSDVPPLTVKHATPLHLNESARFLSGWMSRWRSVRK